MSDNRTIGIIGLGYWGRNILRNLCQMNQAGLACDIDPCAIGQCKKEFPELRYTMDSGLLLRDPSLKGVIISTPAVTHYGLAMRALSAGKDVFVEKPLALEIPEARRLVAFARRQRRVLMVGHILQYHPAAIKLKEIISQGKLGKVQYIYSNRLNIGKLRIEENILWSFAPHDTSLILMLLGEEPKRVFSFGGDYVNNGVCDTTLTSLEFKNGVKAHIFVSWLHPYKEQRLVVVGSQAMAVFDDLENDKLCIYPHKISRSKGMMPVAQKAGHYPLKVGSAEPLKEELRHFVCCMRKRARPLTDGEEGLRVLMVLHAAERSLRNNRYERIQRQG